MPSKAGGRNTSGDFYAPSGTQNKVGEVITEDEAIELAEYNADTDDLHRMMESNRRFGDTDARIAMARNFPADATEEPADARLSRDLPEIGSTRGMVTDHHRRVRNQEKRTAQDSMPQTQYKALNDFVDQNNDAEFEWLQSQLISTQGDPQRFAIEDDHAKIRRIDRAIKHHEQHHNGRDHIVYVNGDLPSCVNHSSIHSFVGDPDGPHAPGTVFYYDSYSVGAHNLSDLNDAYTNPDRQVAYEIRTKRGAYLGTSSKGDTTHVLPRGMKLKVTGTEKAKYENPDGTIGERWVVQLDEVTRD